LGYSFQKMGMGEVKRKGVRHFHQEETRGERGILQNLIFREDLVQSANNAK